MLNMRPTASPTPNNVREFSILDDDNDEMGEECESLLPSLPVAKSLLYDYVYQFQGHWLPKRYLHGTLSCQKHFQPQDSDVFLVTSPKSGTTWLKAAMFSVLNRATYAVGSEDHPLTKRNPHVLVPFLELMLYAQKDVVPDLSNIPAPRLFSTHMPLESLTEVLKKKDSPCKMIYLCRNPKDTLNSLWHFMNKLRVQLQGVEALSIEEAFDFFCKGTTAFGPYWDHVLEYWKKSKRTPEKLMFLKYEELQQEPESQFRKMAEFLERPFSEEEEKGQAVEKIVKLCSFDHLSSLEVNKSGVFGSRVANQWFFRQGKTGDSEHHLSAEMIDKLEQITRDKFSPSGLQM